MKKDRKVIDEAIEKKTPQLKKRYTRRMFLMGLGLVLIALGVVFFAIYFATQNMVVGAPSIFMIAGGVILLKYYWGKPDDAVIEHIGEVLKTQVNSLCLYPDKIVFEDVTEPVGLHYPQKCLNDNRNYYVHIWDKDSKRLIPFILPDQQYYCPRVFAERVLELPAHQKIFTRKPKLLDKIKTGLLVVAILIVWLLILTTTG